MFDLFAISSDIVQKIDCHFQETDKSVHLKFKWVNTVYHHGLPILRIIMVELKTGELLHLVKLQKTGTIYIYKTTDLDNRLLCICIQERF